ncbi:MAG: hypothetical protein J0I80_09105 [Sphingomonas sp.]|nr:hypothetical protein [Sphingomonas sp.]
MSLDQASLQYRGRAETQMREHESCRGAADEPARSIGIEPGELVCRNDKASGGVILMGAPAHTASALSGARVTPSQCLDYTFTRPLQPFLVIARVILAVAVKELFAGEQDRSDPEMSQ